MSKLKIILFAAIAVMILAAAYYAKRKWYNPWRKLSQAKEAVEVLKTEDNLQDGDIIFQSSLSGQSKAIELATHSELSHCGIIFKSKDGFSVLEGVQPVSYTPLEEWIARGKNNQYTIKRLSNASTILTGSVIKKMKEEGANLLGKSYDIYFGWSDEKIYCSELVWKIYKRSTGLSIGRLQLLRDFDLSSQAVKDLMKKRYGDAVPFDDTVISPVSMYNSDLLVSIK